MFLAVKRAPCSEVLGKLTKMIQTILEYSVQTLVRELDFTELSGLVDPGFRSLLKKRK